MKRFGVATLVAVAVVCALPAVAGAHPTKVVPITACGQVITADAALSSDLICSGTALTVAASDVTVHLDGHTIRSADGTGTGIDLLRTTCLSDVSVVDGTIAGFAGGVGSSTPDTCPSGGSGMTVAHVTLTDNGWGVVAADGYPVALDRDTITGPNGIGAGSPYGSTGRVTVTRSKVSITSPTGISVAATGFQTTVDASQLTDGLATNTLDGVLDIEDSHLDGVQLHCSVSGIVVFNSDVVGGPGLGSDECTELIHHDRFVGPGFGIAVGISGASADAEQVTDSTFTGWATAVRIRDAGGLAQTVNDIVISGNNFHDNQTAIAFCGFGCFGSGTIADNVFSHNQGDGVDLASNPSAFGPLGFWLIEDNTAIDNGGLGIDVSGVTVLDGGGNVARHNQPPQCVAVACTTHSAHPDPRV